MCLKNKIFTHSYSSYTRNELWSRNTYFFLVLLNLIQVLVFNACLLGLSESVSLSVRISGFVSLWKVVGQLALFFLGLHFEEKKNPTGDILSSNAPSPFELSGLEPRAAFQKDLSFV